MWSLFEIVNFGNKTIVGDMGSVIHPGQRMVISEEEVICTEDGMDMSSYWNHFSSHLVDPNDEPSC